jgi:ABC-type Fe3+-siderophore transport system permease subunit
VSGALSIAGEIAGAATAMAGLILVFLGATATSFDSYQKQEQNSVRRRYQQRAWTAFAGFAFALAAAFSALLAKSITHEGWAVAGFILLVVALVLVVVAALTTVLEIK